MRHATHLLEKHMVPRLNAALERVLEAKGVHHEPRVFHQAVNDG
jgi:hypothetical protein